MESDRWREIDAVFAAALERAPEDRFEFLATACGDDAELRNEVEALLAADGNADVFMEAPVSVDDLPAEHTEEAAGGLSFGPYRIVRRIDRGGMGIVYLATRADDAYRRRVAIKVLDPGMRTSSLLRRFRSERQILASLDHPNIARLFEGGTTPGGNPYLVMEYIEGLPIDAYCDRERLSVRERLKIFHKVCSAVHYAHQNLVVHRDIKPSNILVTADGEPRLLDFGIAKLLDPGAFPYSVEVTSTGHRPMTPHYASPEQVRGEAITTATDVYSLGVVLYRLLVGRLPHRLVGLPAREVERILSEEEPTRPSTAATRPASADRTGGKPEDAPEALSRKRRSEPEQLRRQLSGDLDNIVLTCLNKDPSRRYGSAEQLAEDLRRHLAGLPVVARHDHLGYQLGAFLRRHKLAVGVVSLMLAMLLVFAGAMARQAAQTARQRDEAELERDKARQVSRFLIDLFREADPRVSRGDTITAREVLDRGAEKIRRELGDQPEIRASFLDAIGTVYLHLGLFEQARPLLEMALEARERRLGSGHLDLAESLDHVAELDKRQGLYAVAETRYRLALAIREKALGHDHPDVGRNLGSLALLARIRGRFAEAEELCQRALRNLRSALGPDHPEVAFIMRALAGTYARMGRLSEAERYLEQALAIDEKGHGELHEATASNLVNLAFLRLDRGQDSEAETMLQRALAIYLKVYGEDHTQVGDALSILARVSKFRGRYDEAEQRLERALAIYERVLGTDHARIAHALVTLARNFKARGEHSRAEPRLERALAIFEQALGADHMLVANCLFELGDSALHQERLAEAEPLLERALAIRETLDPGHPEIAESLRGLAILRRRQGRLEEAEQISARAFSIWEQHPRNPATQGIPDAYASLLRAMGREREALELEQRMSRHLPATAHSS